VADLHCGNGEVADKVRIIDADTHMTERHDQHGGYRIATRYDDVLRVAQD
jgi:hypothetical protein